MLGRPLAAFPPDILFISSTDFQSWTSVNLPYEDMSLTTYQSKFVLVGGWDRSTRKPTNQLLTSTTGRQWEPSLPPMPTKRYETSTVNTRSPELLVVAGGRRSLHEILDEVEILQGNKWFTVDSLPIPAGGMPSTLHDGKLCFMRRGHLENTVLTCSCTSLVSSCSKSSGTDRPLWRQFQAPSWWGTNIISCSSRLVIIDDWGTVRGYSSMAQYWLMTSSTGPTPDRAGGTVTTVLNTGQLIFAHEYGGIYRGAVSGECENYYGDSSFLIILYLSVPSYSQSLI